MWEKEVSLLNNELNRLKNEFDEYISPNPVFTNEDKIRIRKKISQTKFNRVSPSFIPNLLTVALLFIGVFFVGNFFINEVNFSGNDAAMPEPSSAQDEQPMSDNVENEAIKEATTDRLDSTPFNYNNELLTEDLVETYQDFAETKDEELLRYLSPIDIFFLYYHAYAIQDYETMYALYIDDEMYLKPFPTVTSFLDAIETENHKVQLQFIKDEILNNDNLKEVIDDESHAGVWISEEKGLFFGISKNENGIWKVNWYPL
jgi:hypothetical protein